ncbi:hypothetical protein RRF57_011263 [Xylaria bambusicola]|uniref:Secreted protein n=1 Tax=Xylaria bambusicola TaxID=326684 RepID=A0AAN7UYB0_9PEZI
MTRHSIIFIAIAVLGMQQVVPGLARIKFSQSRLALGTAHVRQGCKTHVCVIHVRRAIGKFSEAADEMLRLLQDEAAGGAAAN